MSAIPDPILKQMDADLQILMLVTGTLTNGEAHYAYVSILPSKYEAFKTAEAKGNYDLRAYGEVLHHGAGSAPSAAVQKDMEERYGASHTFEEDFMSLVARMHAEHLPQ